MHVSFRALANRIGRPSALILAAVIAFPVAAAPAVAAPVARSAGGFEASTRVAARSRVSGRTAAAVTATSSRTSASRRSPLVRPAAFARGVAGSTARLATGGRRPLVIAGPGLVSTRGFTGIDQAASGGGEPPDPWVAVSAANVIQSTNGLVRVSTRAGQEVASIATWSLFSVPAGYTDSDPRIIWDAYHGRWVGVVVYYDLAFSDNHLVVIVSDGANPLGSWSIYDFFYGNYLPDYPGLASSSDKIAVTANEFQDGATYAGSSIATLPWASIIAGTDVAAGYAIESTAWNLRPGRIVGTAADIWSVYENGNTGTLTVLRVAGNGAAPVYTTDDLSIPNGTNVSIAPRQPGDPDGIDRADDGRIPDATWRANTLWLARTVEHPYNGTDNDLAVEVIAITTSTTLAPVVAADDLWGGPSGTDTFSPGIGVSGSGTAFFTWARSSAADAPSIQAIAYHPTAGAQGPIELASSDASYGGSRWGDFAGIATDPSGSDTVWQTHETADSLGAWRTRVSRLVFDQTYPTATAPKQELIRGTTLGQYQSSPATVPVKISWTGADAGSGVTRYYLEQNDHGAGFDTALTTSGTAWVNQHTWKPAGSVTDSSWQYRVTAEDDGANIGSTATGSLLTPTGYQQTTSAFTYGSGWSSTTSAKYSGGSAKYSTRVGASASFRTSGRSFGFVTTRATSRGKVKVYVDGSYKGTVTLTSSTTRYRYLAYVITFASSGTHTIKLVVASGRVDVDGFMVLR